MKRLSRIFRDIGFSLLCGCFGYLLGYVVLYSICKLFKFQSLSVFLQTIIFEYRFILSVITGLITALFAGTIFAGRARAEKPIYSAGNNLLYGLVGAALGTIFGFLIIVIPSQLDTGFDQAALLIFFTVPSGFILGAILGGMYYYFGSSRV